MGKSFNSVSAVLAIPVVKMSSKTFRSSEKAAALTSYCVVILVVYFWGKGFHMKWAETGSDSPTVEIISDFFCWLYVEESNEQEALTELWFFPASALSSTSDHILWGQKLPGSLLWVRHRLPWHASPLQPLQLHQGGEWLLGAVWEAQLHRLPVRSDQRGVPRLPALDGLQRHHPLLSYFLLCEQIFDYILCFGPECGLADHGAFRQLQCQSYMTMSKICSVRLYQCNSVWEATCYIFWCLCIFVCLRQTWTYICKKVSFSLILQTATRYWTRWI